MSGLPQVLTNILNRKPDQLGVLVPNLEEGARSWGRIWGVEEWKSFYFSPRTLDALTYRGRPAEYEMKLAIASSDPQIEIIEPVKGASIYAEWIEQRGFGLHHLGYYVESLSYVTNELERTGLVPVQTGEGFGADGTGHYAYYENFGQDGLIIEFIEAAAQRREPEIMKSDVPS